MKRARAVALAAAGTMVAPAGTAWATGAVSSIVSADGSINGCYKEANGQLRVVLSGEACGPSELAVRWNQAGTRGEQGPQGNTLTLTVGGTYQLPYQQAYSCGFLGSSTCYRTAYQTYLNYAVVSSGGARCSAAAAGPQTCTYSIPGGTRVTITTPGTLSAGGGSFDMTADRTVTVS